ncbi:MAG: rRNA maturation RNase YbeY [Rhodothermia bacterium]|nr:MAG: rRNA maturation RNase YbeY [Rhodothermia bacterium]
MSEILISFDFSDDAEFVDLTRLTRLAEHVLETECAAWVRIGIVLTRHDRLRTLNRDFLNHDFNTDVLSFLVEESDAGIEGEVYVDLETAIERHTEFGSTIEEEIDRYVVHGLLHLAGYDDDTPEKKREMYELESRYLMMDP